YTRPRHTLTYTHTHTHAHPKHTHTHTHAPDTLSHTHTHTHTHTSTRPLSCTTHPLEHKNIYLYFLHYPHQQHKITFLLDTDTVKIIAHYNRVSCIWKHSV